MQIRSDILEYEEYFSHYLDFLSASSAGYYIIVADQPVFECRPMNLVSNLYKKIFREFI